MSLKALRILVLICFIGLMTFSAIGLTRLHFAFSFEAFLPPDDPDLAFHQDFNAQFSKGEGSVSLALVRSEGVFDYDFLTKVDSFQKAVRHLPLVTNVHVSLRNLTHANLIRTRNRILCKVGIKLVCSCIDALSPFSIRLQP